MDKEKDSILIEIIAKNILEIIKRLDHIELTLEIVDDILRFLEEIFTPPKEIVKTEDEMVQFSKKLYDEICKYCGKSGITFMGIA